jgi:hypothetical protein
LQQRAVSSTPVRGCGQWRTDICVFYFTGTDWCIVPDGSLPQLDLTWWNPGIWADAPQTWNLGRYWLAVEVFACRTDMDYQDPEDKLWKTVSKPTPHNTAFWYCWPSLVLSVECELDLATLTQYGRRGMVVDQKKTEERAPILLPFLAFSLAPSEGSQLPCCELCSGDTHMARTGGRTPANI